MHMLIIHTLSEVQLFFIQKRSLLLTNFNQEKRVSEILACTAQVWLRPILEQRWFFLWGRQGPSNVCLSGPGAESKSLPIIITAAEANDYPNWLEQDSNPQPPVIVNNSPLIYSATTWISGHRILLGKVPTMAGQLKFGNESRFSYGNKIVK